MKAKCDFCYRECALSEGQRGICHIRVNRDGTIVTENYGEVVALALDPIEKKPLYHFRPGSHTLSVALFGCNLFCSFCQNYSISQNEFYQRRPGRCISPNVFIQRAIEEKVSVSFTYSEPIVWQDYLLDCARMAKNAAVPTILVSSGTFSRASLSRMLPFIDAYSIDRKATRVSTGATQRFGETGHRGLGDAGENLRGGGDHPADRRRAYPCRCEGAGDDASGSRHPGMAPQPLSSGLQARSSRNRRAVSSGSPRRGERAEDSSYLRGQQLSGSGYVLPRVRRASDQAVSPTSFACKGKCACSHQLYGDMGD